MRADAFSMARMRALLRWQTGVRRAEMVRSFSVLTVFFLLFELMLVPSGIMPGLSAFFMVASYLFRTFNMRGDKAKRIGLLMLPASNLEKFVACTLFMALTGVLTTVGAFVVADTLRWAFTAATGLFGRGPWGVPAFLHAYVDVLSLDGGASHATATLFAYSVGLWVLTFFLLAGTVLRRISSGVLALGCFAVVSLFCSLLVQLDVYCMPALMWVDRHLTFSLCLLSGVAVAVSVLQVWLAYKAFCRLSLNYGKWTNL